MGEEKPIYISVTASGRPIEEKPKDKK